MIFSRRKQKYGNRRVEVNGIKFASHREARRWGELRLLQKAGEICSLRRQVSYRLEVNGQLVCKYIADFVYATKDGKEVVEDAKGFRTETYRLKAKLMRAVHGIEIKEV